MNQIMPRYLFEDSSAVRKKQGLCLSKYPNDRKIFMSTKVEFGISLERGNDIKEKSYNHFLRTNDVPSSYLGTFVTAK